jgi:MOSC domain-containing protein YiiM
MTGRIVSVNTSERTGVQKQPQPQVELAVEHGIRGDAHAGDWHRQVSLLAMESIQKMRSCGADVGPGAFGENVTTEGVVVYELPVGTRLRLGDSLCEVTQIGKVCHDRCAIFHQVGDCVMPREGIFVRVLQGGTLRAGDAIEVLAEAPAAESEAAAGAEADHV